MTTRYCQTNSNGHNKRIIIDKVISDARAGWLLVPFLPRAFFFLYTINARQDRLQDARRKTPAAAARPPLPVPLPLLAPIQHILSVCLSSVSVSLLPPLSGLQHELSVVTITGPYHTVPTSEQQIFVEVQKSLTQNSKRISSICWIWKSQATTGHYRTVIKTASGDIYFLSCWPIGIFLGAGPVKLKG